MVLAVVVDKDNGREICRAGFVELDYIYDADQSISSGDSYKVPRSRPGITRVQLSDVSFPIENPGQGRPSPYGPIVANARYSELEFLLAAIIKTLGGGVTLTDAEVIKARDLKLAMSWTPEGTMKLEAVNR